MIRIEQNFLSYCNKLKCVICERFCDDQCKRYDIELNGSTCKVTVYSTGSLLIQGRDSDLKNELILWKKNYERDFIYKESYIKSIDDTTYIDLPNLVFNDTLIAIKQIEEAEIKKNVILYMNKIKFFEPFTMLLIISVLKYKLSGKNILPICTNINEYAEYMGFYEQFGFGKIDREKRSRNINVTHNKITEIKLDKDGYFDSYAYKDKINFGYPHDIISLISNNMASVLAQGNFDLSKALTYMLRELIRNIDEHSSTKNFYYCSQYWPSKDRVELSILDNGIGIRKSLLTNSRYCAFIKDDKTALELSVQPGISRTFLFDKRDILTDHLKNTGFGLYMVSQLCAYLGGSFTIISGKKAMEISKDNKQDKINFYETGFHGTALRLIIRPSLIRLYDEYKAKILYRGERMAADNKIAFSSCSGESKGK